MDSPDPTTLSANLHPTRSVSDADRTADHAENGDAATGSFAVPSADPDATRDGPAPPPAAKGGPVAVPGYEVLGELGRGAMGVVYHARDARLNRPVALKLLRGDGESRGLGRVDRIRRVARALQPVGG